VSALRPVQRRGYVSFGELALVFGVGSRRMISWYSSWDPWSREHRPKGFSVVAVPRRERRR